MDRFGSFHCRCVDGDVVAWRVVGVWVKAVAEQAMVWANGLMGFVVVVVEEELKRWVLFEPELVLNRLVGRKLAAKRSLEPIVHSQHVLGPSTNKHTALHMSHLLAFLFILKLFQYEIYLIINIIK